MRSREDRRALERALRGQRSDTRGADEARARPVKRSGGTGFGLRRRRRDYRRCFGKRSAESTFRVLSYATPREPFIRDSTSLRADDRGRLWTAPGSTPLDSGWCSYRAGSFAEAADDLRRELKLRPGDADAAVGLGYARLQLGDIAQSRSLFSRFLRETRETSTRSGYCRWPACARRRGDPLRARRRSRSPDRRTRACDLGFSGGSRARRRVMRRSS